MIWTASSIQPGHERSGVPVSSPLNSRQVRLPFFLRKALRQEADASYEVFLESGACVCPVLHFRPDNTAAAEIAPQVPSIQPIPRPSPSVIRNRVVSSNPVFSVNAHATDWAQLKPLSWNAIACFALSFPEIPDIRKSPLKYCSCFFNDMVPPCPV